MAREKYIWISALETSADLHGSFLVKRLIKLMPSYNLLGIGGKNMEDLPFTRILRAEDFSVMGLFEVLSYLPRIISSYRKIGNVFKDVDIKAAVLIDAPDFHFRVAKMAWKRGIPVVYYISPQVWAWRRGRINFLKKYVWKLCSIFPFEEDFFAQYGMDVEYVGHPLMEYLNFSYLDSLEKIPDSLVIMPGSRKREISSLLPEFARAVDIIKDMFSLSSIRIVLAPNIERQFIDFHWTSSLSYELVSFNNRYEAIASSEFALVASGTASLECGLLTTPAVVAYRVSPLSYLVGRAFVKVEHISMTNIILEERVFPEFIQGDVRGENFARIICRWKRDPSQVDSIKKKLLLLRSRFGDKRASHETAKVVISALSRAGT